jgi:N-acetylneuraminic acid mutarotase
MRGETRATMLMLMILCVAPVAFPNVEIVKTAGDYWTNLVPLPVTSHSMGVTVLNGTLYVVGVDKTSNTYNYQYDPNTNTWLAKTQMPTPRIGFALTAFQNKIYVINGFAGLGVAPYTLVYDPTTDSWEEKDDSMPKQITGMEANVVDGKIYLIGGGSPVNPFGLIPAIDYNLVYDPEIDSWNYLERMPTAVKYYASAVVDGKIYIIGGSNPLDFPNESLNLVQIFDPKTNQWSQGTPIPIGVSGAAAGATTDELAPKRIYVFGGSPMDPESEPCNLTQVYDPEKDVWITGASMPTPDRDFGVDVVNDELYVITGNNYKYTPIGYIPEFPSWTPLLITLVSVVAVTVIYRRKISKSNRWGGNQ